jgi:hypothetical protein
MKMNVFTRIGQLMGDPRVTDFELHVFTTAFATLALMVKYPHYLTAVTAVMTTVAAVKEFGIDYLRNPQEPISIGVRDFTYYMIGILTATVVMVL